MRKIISILLLLPLVGTAQKPTIDKLKKFDSANWIKEPFFELIYNPQWCSRLDSMKKIWLDTTRTYKGKPAILIIDTTECKNWDTVNIPNKSNGVSYFGMHYYQLPRGVNTTNPNIPPKRKKKK